MTSFHRQLGALLSGVIALALLGRAAAFPVDGDKTVLPVATELNEDALDKPREVFQSERTGAKSYLVNLGDLACAAAAAAS